MTIPAPSRTVGLIALGTIAALALGLLLILARLAWWVAAVLS